MDRIRRGRDRMVVAGTEINFYVHKQIIACYQNCYKQIVWIL